MHQNILLFDIGKGSLILIPMQRYSEANKVYHNDTYPLASRSTFLLTSQLFRNDIIRFFIQQPLPTDSLILPLNGHYHRKIIMTMNINLNLLTNNRVFSKIYFIRQLCYLVQYQMPHLLIIW